MEETLIHDSVICNPGMNTQFYYSDEKTGKFFAPHWHNALEIIFVIGGTITVEFPEKKTSTANAGEFIIINSTTVHSVLNTPNKVMVFQIPISSLKKYVSNYEGLQFYNNMTTKDNKNAEKINELKKLFFEIYKTYESKPDGWLLRFNSLLYDIIYILLRFYSKRDCGSSIKSSEHMRCIMQICDYIKEYHREPLSISEIANLFHYSNDYISRLFKKHMSCTIVEYIYAVRLNCVAKDIRSTNDSVSEIFERHGCTNYGVALREFKKLWGCSPREFRKNNMSLVFSKKNARYSTSKRML